MARVVDLQREYLMTWNLLEQRKTALIWRISSMTDDEVSEAYEELDELIMKINKLDDMITDQKEADEEQLA